MKARRAPRPDTAAAPITSEDVDFLLDAHTTTLATIHARTLAELQTLGLTLSDLVVFDEAQANAPDPKQ